MQFRIFAFLTLVLTLPIWGEGAVMSGAAEKAVRYQVDPVHSHIGFGVRHMVISTVRGQFGEFTGSVETESSGLLRALYGEVTVKSLNTRNAKRDGHLLSGDFFSAGKFPKMTLASLEIKNGEAGTFILTGNLTLRGVTQKIIFTGEASKPITDPWGNKRMGLALEAEIDRTQFGMRWSKHLDSGGLVVGNKVKINLELEALRKP